MVIVDGKKLAEEILNELKLFFEQRKISLAIISVGVKNEATESFVRQKQKVADILGVKLECFNMDNGNFSNKSLRGKINEIARKKSIHSIIVQLPLPENIKTQYVLNAIPVEKDPDCLNERSLGALLAGRLKILPPAVEVVKFIFQKYYISLNNKKCVMVGVGRLVGGPIASWLMQQKGTVSVVNEFTASVQEFVSAADIVISGAGRPELIKNNWIKKGAVVIDFGCSFRDGKITGDIDWRGSEANLVVPTPGGTGPILVAMLFSNIKKLAES